VRPNVVQLDGKEQRFNEGTYYIEGRDPKRKRECVGTPKKTGRRHYLQGFKSERHAR
jgi:hypothetical protein